MTPQERFEAYEYDMTRMDMSYAMRTTADQVRVLHHFKDAIEKFHEKFTDLILEIGTEKIEITSPDRESGQLGWFLQCFPGKYEKKPNDYGNGIDFVLKVNHPLKAHRKFYFKATSVTPPPSCVIEEYDEVVPEHTIKKKKVVCKEGVDDQEPLPPEDVPAMTDSMQEVAVQNIEPAPPLPSSDFGVEV